MEGLKFMIAEDGKELVQLMEDFFEDKKEIQIVGTHSDGVTLLNALRVTQVDVLILDIFMPNCDGIKVLQELKLKKENFKQPKILLSLLLLLMKK